MKLISSVIFSQNESLRISKQVEEFSENNTAKKNLNPPQSLLARGGYALFCSISILVLVHRFQSIQV